MEEEECCLEIITWAWCCGTVRTNNIGFEKVCGCSVWSPVWTEKDKKMVLANVMDTERCGVSGWNNPSGT